MAFTHKHPSMNPHKHDTVEQFYDCEEEYHEAEATMLAELEAERRAERYYEEGSDAEQAARWAEEEYERQRIGG